MSISEQITLLANSKQAIKTSINKKGGSVTDSTPFADYSTAIDNLPSGGDDSTLRDLIERDITSITIPSGTTTIGKSGLSYCRNLTSVTIPSSVTSYAEAAFYFCVALTSVNIPSGATSLSNSMFGNCTALTTVSIPNTVTTIGNYAFQSCRSLTSVTIPSSVTIINDSAFNDCRGLNSITCLPTTPPTLGYNVFDGTNNCPIYVPDESVDAYKAATNWSSLASRIFPITQLATVDGNPVYNYEIGNTNATEILDVQLAKMPAGTSVEFAEGLNRITAGEINYQEVTLPSTFTGFGDSNQIGSNVTTITSNAVTPPGAFRNQLGGSGLTAIYVPASAVDAYKENATWSSFASIIQAIPVPAMKWVSADGTQEISIDCEDLENPGYLTQNDVNNADPDYLVYDVEGSAEIGGCVTTIGAGGSVFDGSPSLTSVTIGSGVTTIGDTAFSGCSALTNVTIPGSVTSINNNAFKGCTSLTSINIPDSVTSIGGSASGTGGSVFEGCTSLTSVTIGNGVTTIGNGSFTGCSSLTSVTVNATTPPTIGRVPFNDASASLVIYVPAESVDAYKAATNWSGYADRIQAIPAE